MNKPIGEIQKNVVEKIIANISTYQGKERIGTQDGDARITCAICLFGQRFPFLIKVSELQSDLSKLFLHF